MEINSLKTEEEYEAALKGVEQLPKVAEKTADAEQMENLLGLIEYTKIGTIQFLRQIW